MKPQLYILCVLCAFVVNISFSQDLSSPDQTKQLSSKGGSRPRAGQALDKLIESQSATPTLDGIKLVFSAYSNGTQAIRSAIEKSIPRLKITDEIHAWLKTDAAKSPNKDIRMLTLRITGADSYPHLNLDFPAIFLYDPNEQIRLENIKHLNELTDTAVIPLLTTAFTDGYYPVRRSVLEALSKYNYTPQALDVIIKRYPDESSMTLQFEMEETLVSMIDDTSMKTEILMGYLNSDLPVITALISRVIGKSTRIKNLKDTNNYVRALSEPKNDDKDVIASREWALRQLKGNETRQHNETKPQGRIITALLNRFEPNRKESLSKYSGGAETEKAVRLGLKWLAANQEKDGPQGHPVGGSWNCARHNPWHNNVVLPAFTNEDELVDVSVSALSLLCFMGDGSTHQSGLYQDAVKKGLEFIKTAQDQTGCINIPKGHVHNKQCLEQGEDHGPLPRRYNHNISTLFLVELYAMTGDAEIKDMAQRALEHSRNKPEPGFPWSFYLEPTDMGPSIFYILALRIAQETDLLVSPKEIDRTKVYLDRLTDKPSGRIVHICAIPICFGGMDSTASGLFGHILMKSDKEIITKGANWLKAFPPQWEPFYQYTDYYPNLLFLEDNFMNEWHWYYQTLAFRQIGGDYWSEWNRKHKEVLLKHQRIGGLLDGSWDPEGPWATIGGRVYSTAFSILSLQAYYSYEFK